MDKEGGNGDHGLSLLGGADPTFPRRELDPALGYRDRGSLGPRAKRKKKRRKYSDAEWLVSPHDEGTSYNISLNPPHDLWVHTLIHPVFQQSQASERLK